MTSQIRTSVSKTKCYRGCKKKYHYKYVLMLIRKFKSLPLFRGVIIHDLLDAIANKKSWTKLLSQVEKKHGTLFFEERETYGDIIEDIKTIVTMYVKHYGKKGKISYVSKGKNYSELKVEHKIERGISFLGYIDKLELIGKDAWLIEHKTHKKFPSEEQRMSDIQTVVYKKFIKKALDINVKGVIWDYIRTKPPTIPELLKNGALSKNKKIDTTPDIYKQAIRDNDLKVVDYSDILDTLKGKEDSFLRRIKLPFSKHMVEEVYEDFIHTSREMLNDDGEHYPRNLNKDCSWCDYYSLCHAELYGLDTSWILKHDYEVKKDGKKEI